MADEKMLSFEEFRKEQNRRLIGSDIKELIATLTNVSTDTREKLLDMIGERINEYGEDRFHSGQISCSCYAYCSCGGCQ